MNVVFPIKVEVRGKASSTYDEGTITRRLEVLRGREDAAEEIAFLEKLLGELQATKE